MDNILDLFITGAITAAIFCGAPALWKLGKRKKTEFINNRKVYYGLFYYRVFLFYVVGITNAEMILMIVLGNSVQGTIAVVLMLLCGIPFAVFYTFLYRRCFIKKHLNISLPEAPSEKIIYNAAQEISDEILRSAIQFCGETGYKQNRMMLTFFWTSFLFLARKSLYEVGIFNDTLNCFTYSLGKVFPKISEDAELRESVNNMRQQYWTQISIDFDALCTETEVSHLIEIADELNAQGSSTTKPLKEDPAKNFLHYSSNINSNILHILQNADSSMGVQDKCALDEPPLAMNNQPVADKASEIPAVPKLTSSEESENIFCRKCGTKLYDDSAFCHKCGTEIIK